MDLRESMRDSAKAFRKGLHVQLATKLFCLKPFMVYGISVFYLDHADLNCHWQLKERFLRRRLN